MPSGPKATTGSDARSQVPPAAVVMPGTAWWCQCAPPSCVHATEMSTAPPSGNRESCAAAIAMLRLRGSTATSGSTTVSVSEPGCGRDVLAGDDALVREHRARRASGCDSGAGGDDERGGEEQDGGSAHGSHLGRAGDGTYRTIAPKCLSGKTQSARPLVDDAAHLAHRPLDAVRVRATSTRDADADGVLDQRAQLLAGRGRVVRRWRPARRSTRTVSSSSRPARLSTHWKCGDSAGVRRISSSIWVGNRFTPRRMIMSSVRPVIFSIRRIGARGARAAAG